MTKVLIRSEDRTSDSISSSDFKYQFPAMFNTKNMNSVKLLYFLCPNSIYNVTNSNNSLRWNDGVNNLTTTIPAGNYSVTALCTTLASAMTTSSGSLTVSASFSSTTYFITISASGTFSMDMNHTSTTISQVIGFSGTYTGANSYTGNSVPRVARPQHLELSCWNLSGDGFGTNGPTVRWDFIIPVNTNGGDNIEYSDAALFEQVVSANYLPNEIRVSLKVNGTVVNLNGGEFIFILELK